MIVVLDTVIDLEMFVPTWYLRAVVMNGVAACKANSVGPDDVSAGVNANTCAAAMTALKSILMLVS